jgi:hypothetical protein
MIRSCPTTEDNLPNQTPILENMLNSDNQHHDPSKLLSNKHNANSVSSLSEIKELNKDE